MKDLIFYSFLLLVLSCKKEEKIYYPDGTPKYLNEWKNNVLNINRYDSKGNLILKGKFKDSEFIDTLYIYEEDDNESFIQIDSSDSNLFFYGTYIAKYSTGKIAKKAPLRFEKGHNLDSILSSSKSFGKEFLYNPKGVLVRETDYKIIGDSSVIIDEKIYDPILMK
ncbi:hypothetical protein [Chryseobacterium sp. CT-SW4]|uniref:hypothetical protein n=1 Tax=Chryseobacterium sp. SW-1 TaxID=3157343 RepID=UPI003B019B35